MDATSLLQDSGLLTALPDLPDQIQDHPESTLNSMGLALHMVHTNSLYVCVNGDCVSGVGGWEAQILWGGVWVIWYK